MKYEVNRVTLVGNVCEAPRVTERDGEAFVANFPLATNEFYRNKEGVKRYTFEINGDKFVFIDGKRE